MITVNDIVECSNCGPEPCIVHVLRLSPLRLRVIADLQPGSEHRAGDECNSRDGVLGSLEIEKLRPLTPSEQLTYLL